MTGLRIGVVILPDLDWPEAQARWREAEQIGFSNAWTYDHMSWRTLRDGPWLGTVPLLGAVAAATNRIRIGTLVTSPNFRHPVVLAKEVMTLDRISGGRFDLGVGAGGTGFDAEVLGQPSYSVAERGARFAEFVGALDLLLREPASSFTGSHFKAVESRTVPGCVQQPRVPFTIAAAGSRAMDVAVNYGASWVTFGPLLPAPQRRDWFTHLREQAATFATRVHAAGRDLAAYRRKVLIGLELAWAQDSVAAFDAVCDEVAALGFTDVIVHWPRAHDPDLPGVAPAVFDEICNRVSAQQSADGRDQ